MMDRVFLRRCVSRKDTEAFSAFVARTCRKCHYDAIEAR